MDYENLSLEDLKNGYRRFVGPQTGDGFVCNQCGAVFPSGQVFPVDGNFFEAETAARLHAENVHGGSFSMLCGADTKYNTLTDNQKELLAMFHAGKADAEIAKAMGVTASTVRKQKFDFREKAKQARHYLAVFETAFGGKPANGEDLMPIPESVPFFDDRFVITEQEREHILETCFELLDPPILSVFPVKEKKKVVILTKIAEQFEAGREYSEKEVSAILKSIYADFVTLRRYLIEYGLLARTEGGSKYWKC